MYKSSTCTKDTRIVTVGETLYFLRMQRPQGRILAHMNVTITKMNQYGPMNYDTASTC